MFYCGGNTEKNICLLIAQALRSFPEHKELHRPLSMAFNVTSFRFVGKENGLLKYSPLAACSAMNNNFIVLTQEA